MTGRPDFAATRVAEIDVAAPLIAGHVFLPTGDVEIAPAAVARTGAGQHNGVSAVRDQVRQRDARMRRLMAALNLRCEVVELRGRLLLLRGRTRDRDIPRHALLKEKLGRLHSGLGVESLAHIGGRYYGRGCHHPPNPVGGPVWARE